MGTTDTQLQSFWVVVPAAGTGKRMGAKLPKQYLPLCGRPLISHTLENILSWPGLAGVVVAISAGDTWFAGLPEAADPLVQRVTGGAERADSVLAALDFLTDKISPDTPVLVHDAARPFVDSDEIKRLMSADTAPIALLAQPASDTVKQSAQRKNDSDQGPGGEQVFVACTLPREQIWLAQTPQRAPLTLLQSCIREGLQHGAPITDEASALELAGQHPQLIPAQRDNFKITHPSDLLLAEAILQFRQRFAEENSA